MEERELATQHLIHLDVKWIRKETKKLKKSIKAFMLLDRDMWMSFFSISVSSEDSNTV
jgi:hypothetical protein